MTSSPKVFAQFAYTRHADQGAAKPVHHAVVIIGAGPVGLALAIDLAQRGIRSVVLDDSDRIGDGSRAICFAKKTLEIFDRLGIAAPALAKGVEWRVGKVFQGSEQVYQFDLLPEPGHKMPAFINLQQYYVEKFLVDRIATLTSGTLNATGVPEPTSIALAAVALAAAGGLSGRPRRREAAAAE